jgi:hypothetical protein
VTKKPRKPRPKPKGVFCLEGDWSYKIHKASTVEPILSLLSKWDPYYVPYIHRDIATRDELEYYLLRWTRKSLARYPILYLAFHGDSERLLFGDVRYSRNTVTLDDVAGVLEARCRGRIIYFASCSTLKLHGNLIRGFLKRTGALAVCGYRKEVDWLDATAFELMVFGAMQRGSLTSRGARAMERRIHRHAAYLARRLEFRMVVRS